MDTPALIAAIKIPAAAVVPLLIALVVIGLIAFAGNALVAWQQRSPGTARATGYAIAVVASAAAIYLAARVVPATRSNDPVHEGVQLVSLLDPVISAFCAAVAGVMWRYAGKRWIGGLLASALAAALIAKPFIYPLFSTYDGVPSTFSPTSETHLYFLLSGIALDLVAVVLIVWRAAPARLPAAHVRG